MEKQPQTLGESLIMSTLIESKKVTVGTTNTNLFDFAMDLSNFEKLLPEGKIDNFKSDQDSCSFEIKGIATMGLKHVENERPNRILLASKDSPFPFTLEILIQEDSDGKTIAHQVSNLDINPFMKMMVQKPLKNLFDHIADRLVIEFEEA
ncbi:MAG: hypothetical protein ACI8XB_000064 [Patiriisocius sp.]|jgi:hypothetical protein